MNNTEDETFRILSRISFNELEIKAQNWVYDMNDHRSIVEFLIEHGWTENEYNNHPANQKVE